jgi:hypothetical protein
MNFIRGDLLIYKQLTSFLFEVARALQVVLAEIEAWA